MDVREAPSSRSTCLGALLILLLNLLALSSSGLRERRLDSSDRSHVGGRRWCPAVRPSIGGRTRDKSSRADRRADHDAVTEVGSEEVHAVTAPRPVPSRQRRHGSAPVPTRPRRPSARQSRRARDGRRDHRRDDSAGRRNRRVSQGAAPVLKQRLQSSKRRLRSSIALEQTLVKAQRRCSSSDSGSSGDSYHRRCGNSGRRGDHLDSRWDRQGVDGTTGLVTSCLDRGSASFIAPVDATVTQVVFIHYWCCTIAPITGADHRQGRSNPPARGGNLQALQ